MSRIEAKALSCGYGDKMVLEQLSLSFARGQVSVLLGPNGCGKTTLLRALARMLRPHAGTVLLEGKDIWQGSHNQLTRQLAMTPQNERRDWPLSVEQSIRLGRTPHRGWLQPLTEADQQIVDAALHDTGLTSLRQRRITELSGGEWRRMILARALAQQAQSLLLDEPTAGLDLKYQVEVLSLARRLAHRGNLLVVMTMHDLNHAAQYADRVALISNKSIVVCGPPAQVLTEATISKVYEVPVSVTSHPVHGTTLISVAPAAE